jgi:ferredoxin
MSAIYWFSGTGNSLHAAKLLSAELEIPIYPIASGAPAKAVGGEGEKIGFVFPSYYGNLPRIVRRFVDELEILPGTYLFAIVTMGGFGHGSIVSLSRLLEQKSLKLSYGRGIAMPPNYVMIYDPANVEKSKPKLDKAGKAIRRFSNEIASGRKTGNKLNIGSQYLYKNIGELDAKFYANESCNACGRCVALCPVQNIEMEGKPKWLHHCEHCAACISWCPMKSIQYGNKTRTRRRYHNPRIELREILPANTAENL